MLHLLGHQFITKMLGSPGLPSTYSQQPPLQWAIARSIYRFRNILPPPPRITYISTNRGTVYIAYILVQQLIWLALSATIERANSIIVRILSSVIW